MIDKAIKHMRKSAGMSQIELAKKINKALTTISAYELGTARPHFETVVKIAKACDFEILIKDKNNGEIINLKK